MLQFRIRSLFGLILAVAIFLGIAQTAGYVVAAGILIALFLLLWAVLCRQGRCFIYHRVGIALFAMVVIWFLAVDWSWLVEECPACNYRANIGQYRVLGIPVHTQVHVRRSIPQLILNDLGVPCEHQYGESWRKYRYSGLVFLTWPRIHDIHLTDDPDYIYTDAMAVQVRQIGDENPQLAAELHDLFVKKRDGKTFWKRIQDLTKDAREVTE